MSVLDTLIYNRTQNDVDAIATLKQKILSNGYSSLSAAEVTTWTSGVGAYRHTDLNRVGQAVSYIASEMITAITTISNYLASKDVAKSDEFLLPWEASDIVVTAKQDWAINSHVPTLAEMTAYLADLTLIATNLSVTDPEVPASMSNLTYSTANGIEELLIVAYQALLDLIAYKEDMIDRAAMSFIYSGEFYSGEGT